MNHSVHMRSRELTANPPWEIAQLTGAYLAVSKAVSFALHAEPEYAGAQSKDSTTRMQPEPLAEDTTAAC